MTTLNNVTKINLNGRTITHVDNFYNYNSKNKNSSLLTVQGIEEAIAYTDKGDFLTNHKNDMMYDSLTINPDTNYDLTHTINVETSGSEFSYPINCLESARELVYLASKVHYKNSTKEYVNTTNNEAVVEALTYGSDIIVSDSYYQDVPTSYMKKIDVKIYNIDYEDVYVLQNNFFYPDGKSVYSNRNINNMYYDAAHTKPIYNYISDKGRFKNKVNISKNSDAIISPDMKEELKNAYIFTDANRTKHLTDDDFEASGNNYKFKDNSAVYIYAENIEYMTICDQFIEKYTNYLNNNSGYPINNSDFSTDSWYEFPHEENIYLYFVSSSEYESLTFYVPEGINAGIYGYGNAVPSKTVAKVSGYKSIITVPKTIDELRISKNITDKLDLNILSRTGTDHKLNIYYPKIDTVNHPLATTTPMYVNVIINSSYVDCNITSGLNCGELILYDSFFNNINLDTQTEVIVDLSYVPLNSMVLENKYLNTTLEGSELENKIKTILNITKSISIDYLP